MIIHLGCMSPCTSSNLPGNRADHTLQPKLPAPLFGLAPGGVYPATDVATGAVRSYRTISPLPASKDGRYIFCGTFHRLAPSRRYLAPCPMEPGLSSARKSGDHPADSQGHDNATSLPTQGFSSSHQTSNQTGYMLSLKQLHAGCSGSVSSSHPP